jgi:hypothetical protein
MVKSRRMRRTRNITLMEEMRNDFTKPEGKRHRHKWKDNIKIDIRKIRFEDVDWDSSALE